MNETPREFKGDGSTDVAVGDRLGKVTLLFPQATDWVAMDPSNAVQIGKAMIDAAVQCGARVTIQAPRQPVPHGLRERMVNRTVMMLRNKREGPEKDNILAQRIVDTVLNIIDL